MDKVQFISILESKVRDYNIRPILSNAVLQHPDWLGILLENMTKVNDKESPFSARILELACKKELDILLPYLNEFTEIIPTLKLDGSIRASAKIIELLCIEYYIKNNPTYRKGLHDDHLEKFTESCFDWMIVNKAIAIQAHSMYALYLLGTTFDWVHTELILNIERNLPNGSAGYQNRGKKILTAIYNPKNILKLY